MIKRTGQLLLTVALIAAIGGHWAALQTVAWTTMLADNLRNSASLTEAVAKTFDGNHPCTLCTQISVGKKSEKKTEFQFGLKKLEFTFRQLPFLFCPPQFFHDLGRPHDELKSLTQAPPLPPPRPTLA